MENVGKIETKKFNVGDMVEGKVIEILSGMVSDFVSEKGLKKWDNPEMKMYQITVETPLGYNKEFLLPNTEYVTPKSKLAHWEKVNGALPYEGQIIKMIFNADGNLELL